MTDRYYHSGESLTLREWSERTGILPETLAARLRRGWSIERTLTQTLREKDILQRGEKMCSRCKITKPLEDFCRLARRSGNEFQPACRQCDRARTRNSRLELRTLILTHYSSGEMKCQICSERRLDVLDLDHINGGGNKERGKFKTPQAFYLWVRNSGFPMGYRILCRNCNWIEWIKRKDGSLI